MLSAIPRVLRRCRLALPRARAAAAQGCVASGARAGSAWLQRRRFAWRVDTRHALRFEPNGSFGSWKRRPVRRDMAVHERAHFVKWRDAGSVRLGQGDARAQSQVRPQFATWGDSRLMRSRDGGLRGLRCYAFRPSLGPFARQAAGRFGGWATQLCVAAIAGSQPSLKSPTTARPFCCPTPKGGLYVDWGARLGKGLRCAPLANALEATATAPP